MKAFPSISKEPINDGEGCWYTPSSEGMELRDYFAAKAMQGLLTQGEAYLDLKAASYEKNAFWEYVAEISYTLADAMMEARNDNK